MAVVDESLEFFVLYVEYDFVEKHDGVVVDFFFVFTIEGFDFSEDGFEVIDELLFVGTGEGEESFEGFDFEDGGTFG